jgi:hypothetical protein
VSDEAGARVSVAGLHKRVVTLEKQVKEHGTRLTDLENALIAIDQLGDTLNKIKGALKVYGPVIVAAAVSAGLIDGRIGAFFRALFTP